MRIGSRWGRQLVAFVALLVGLGGTAFAQLQTGNVFGSVADDKGQALPGVTATLSGGGLPVVATTDAEGNFRFIGVSPGVYKLESTLDGFSPVVYEEVTVNVGRNTTLNLTMNAAVADVITITGESPLLDSRKISTGATVDKTELEKIPSARDPWVMLATTPGVLVDRINVGGNESGQQSTYVGNGDDGRNSTWSVDGVEITDVGAIGSSSSYYDFDAFEEINVSTGGSDAASRTGGVGINMVTKRGTNEWRGSGRYITDKDSWQSDFDPSAGDFAQAGPWNQNSAQAAFKAGNRIVKVEDYGAEIGGPIVKDKLWIWGSYGKNKINLLTVSDFADDTQLETINGKLNWQIATNNSASVFYSNNDKTKQGRNASPLRTQPTTWNQGGLSSDPKLFKFFNERPTVMKLEDTHIFGSNFFLTGMYSEVSGGFYLTPQGGIGDDHANAQLNLSTSVWTQTYVDAKTARPQDQYKADGSYFFATGNLNHELKFGANYRKAEVRSFSRWPGWGIDLSLNGGGLTNYLFYTSVIADGILNYDVKYENTYVQDTITSGNLTANIGLRYDVQSGEQAAGSTRAVPGFEAFLPAYSTPGGSPGFDDWKDIQPRLGLTYALGAEKKTLLRASYSRFVDQLSGAAVGQTYPIYPAPYVGFYAYDTNGNGKIDRSEVLPNASGHGPNYNPNTRQVVPTYGVDPGLKAPTTDELVLGVEHALLPEFVVGFNVTWRKINDLLETELLVFDGDPYSVANGPTIGRKVRSDDWEVTETHTVVLPDGKARQVPVYSLRSGVASRGGTFLENSDSSQDYLGLSFTFNKRLSNRWMARGNFSWNDWKWNVPSAEAANAPQNPVGGGNDGDRVVTCVGAGSGAKAGICISSQWSYSMSGMYQVAPEKAWGFNVAAALNGRQGYANNYFIRAGRAGFPGAGDVLTSATARPDDYKNDDVHVLDLRIEKEFKFDKVGLTIGADVFNALNTSTVLQRNLRLDYPTRSRNRDRSLTGDHVQEVLSPRIFRLGAKITFN